MWCFPSLAAPAPDGVKPQLSNQVDSSANTPSASPLPNAASQPRTSVKTEPVKQEPPSSASIKQEAPSAASTTSANSPPSSLPDKPRSAASDGQAFELHQDKTRDTCMKLIYDALVYDSVARGWTSSPFPFPAQWALPFFLLLFHSCRSCV